ncbi:hypothetical protein [Cytobacillus sp. IB215665]|uniref:hypothetical protein n=1 Tax=Cytobacillus sp. IB215665 TaxID=3097357 RepID=UPI002A160587|nr:hypothetical protein [Cytobacillus sp. IB215665]MDX8367134.1 hypothetical protein [Cytobacillus sp. IB215665]
MEVGDKFEILYIPDKRNGNIEVTIIGFENGSWGSVMATHNEHTRNENGHNKRECINKALKRIAEQTAD